MAGQGEVLYMARTKKYVTDDGCFLDIDTMDDYHLAWWLPEEGEFGAYVGEVYCDEKEPTDRDKWEMWAAYHAVKPFADGTHTLNGFYFSSKKKAQLALQAANDSLLSNAPWPEWAVRAKAAGWTPPKDWKP